MRELTGHKVNPANDVLKVEVLDEPSTGGACHRYLITVPRDVERDTDTVRYAIHFQHGAINEVGVNGITHEALLAILIDRLEHFQKGSFANSYNATALSHLQDAQSALLERTRERMARNVEGTHTI
jgi:hypothetical protein